MTAHSSTSQSTSEVGFAPGENKPLHPCIKSRTTKSDYSTSALRSRSNEPNSFYTARFGTLCRTEIGFTGNKKRSAVVANGHLAREDLYVSKTEITGFILCTL